MGTVVPVGCRRYFQDNILLFDLLDHLGCRLNKSGNIGKISRDDHGVVFFGKFAEFSDVFFRKLQIDRFVAALAADGAGNGGDTVGGGFSDQTDLFGTAFGFVDTFLLFTLGVGDGFAFFTFGAVDAGLAFTFGFGDLGAFFA